MSKYVNEVLVDGDKLEDLFKKYDDMKVLIEEQEDEISELKDVNKKLSKSNVEFVQKNIKLVAENNNFAKKLEEVIYKLDLANTFKDRYKNKVASLELTKPHKINIDKYV